MHHFSTSLRRVIAAALLIAGVAVTGSTAHAADTVPPALNWGLTLPTQNGYYFGASFDDEVTVRGTHILHVGIPSRYCDSFTDSRCVGNTDQFSWVSLLPTCADATSLDCVAGLTVSGASGAETAALTGTLPDWQYRMSPTESWYGTTLNADPENGIPTPGKIGLWRSEKYRATSSVVYAVVADVGGLKYMHSPLTDSEIFTRKKMSSFHLKVIALRPFITGTDKFTDCWSFSLDTNCYVRVDLPADVRFEPTVRLSTVTARSGWLHGRLSSASMATTAINGGVSLTIGGLPAATLTAGGYAKCGDPALPAAIAKIVADSAKAIGGECQPSKVMAPAATAPGGLGSHETLKTWLPVLGDKTLQVVHAWSLQSRSGFSVDSTFQSDCFKLGLAGIVSTNATSYDEYPTLDASTGSLNYRITAPHFMPDGSTLVQGQYDVVVSKTFAACQWGLDPSTTSATLTVSYDSGVQGAVKPNVSFAADGDFFRISATGFSFSSPKVKVTFKDSARTAKKTVKLGKTKKLAITALAKPSSSTVSSWRVVKGKCSIAFTQSYNKGTLVSTSVLTARQACLAMLVKFNKKTNTASRTLVSINP